MRRAPGSPRNHKITGPAPAGPRKLLGLIEALRPLGLDASVPDVAKALHRLFGNRRSGLLIFSERLLKRIMLDAQHQTIIDAVVSARCKRDGYETANKDAYPDYLKACERFGLEPLALKTFLNRAFRREARWEKRHGKVQS